MQDVVQYGTGKLADFGTMPIAGKTGTAGTIGGSSAMRGLRAIRRITPVWSGGDTMITPELESSRISQDTVEPYYGTAS